MAARESKHGRTVALVGGAGLLAWLLLRGGAGRGRGLGPGQGASSTPARCRVWIRGDHLEIDGVVADLSTIVARCRAVGAAEVSATGDALTGAISNVLRALHVAGVRLYTAPDLSRLVPSEPLL